MAINPTGRPSIDDTPSTTTIFTTVTTRALALQEVALALSDNEDIEGMAAALVPVVAGAVGSREGCLFLSETKDEYRPVSFHGTPADLKAGLEESLVEQAAASVAGSAEGVVARAGILEDGAYVAWCQEQGIQGDARLPYFEIYAPLRVRETVVGVLALCRRADGRDFGKDDLRFIEHVCSSTALALSRHLFARENARQMEMLRALARFTREITSTLDLNRVLLTVSNTTQAVVERDRALVALVEGGKLKVRAVSEKMKVEVNEAEVLGIATVLDVILRRRGRVHVAAYQVDDEGADVPDREVFARYFEAGDMQSILALPLQDEEGLLGYLVLESRNPAGFLDAESEEFLGILSGSVSVAIRNADLYRRLPMVGFLAPFAAPRRRLDAMNPRARTALLGGVAAAALFAAVVPLPRQAVGPALVRPSEILAVTALAPGIVERVYAGGGDRLVAGSPVASLRNAESSARLAAAEADLAIAQRRAAEASLRRDPAEAQRWSLEARNLASWMDYARSSIRWVRMEPVTGAVRR